VWQAADEFCRRQGYALIALDSPEENTWASEMSYALMSERWWMGFNDLEREGDWRWVSGQNITYTNWDPPDEPNDAARGEDCGQLNRWWPAQTWNDEPCQTELPFICEKP
jgi:hypothetical protein